MCRVLLLYMVPSKQKMDKRELELTKLNEYISDVDKEVTLLLQTLQWDHKHLIESPQMVSCKYVAEHRIPLHSAEAHEKQCYLTQAGYNKKDVLLPDPVNPNADTVVKLSKQDIMNLINTAASLDPSFRKGSLTQGAGSGTIEPLTAERLQQVYSADERRAIHDAVVAAAPVCHNLTDLALASCSGEQQTSKVKSRAEILAELRDMKRRRARYRVAAKTTNYSDVLRDVIKTQMELYAEAKGIFIKTDYGTKRYVSLNKPVDCENDVSNVVIKQERISPDQDNYSKYSRRHRERSRTPDKRGRRSGYEDERNIPKRSRDRYVENSCDKRKYKDFSRDKYFKEKRRNDYGSQQEPYHRTKNTVTNEGSNKHDDTRKEESNTTKHNLRYSEKDRQRRYVDRNYDTKNTSRCESSSKEYVRYRSYKEDHSKKDRQDRKTKYD